LIITKCATVEMEIILLMRRIFILDKFIKRMLKDIDNYLGSYDAPNHVAIAGTVLLVLLAIFAIIRSIALRG
jgi:hypothetical protein